MNDMSKWYAGRGKPQRHDVARLELPGTAEAEAVTRFGKRSGSDGKAAAASFSEREQASASTDACRNEGEVSQGGTPATPRAAANDRQ